MPTAFSNFQDVGIVCECEGGVSCIFCKLGDPSLLWEHAKWFLTPNSSLEKGLFAYSKGFEWFECIPHSSHFLCKWTRSTGLWPITNVACTASNRGTFGWCAGISFVYTCKYFVHEHRVHVINTYKWWVCEQFVANHLQSVVPTNTKDVRSSVGTVFVCSFTVFVCSFPNSEDVKVLCMGEGLGKSTKGKKGSWQLVRHFPLMHRKFAER